MPSVIYPEFRLPSLDALRKQAKIWRNQLLAGDPQLTAHYRQAYPDPDVPVSLQRIQHLVAQSSGFKSWLELRRHLVPLEFPVQLRAFVGDDGRLKAWPVKRSRQLIFLDLLTQRIRPGVGYSERQFNTLLNCYHSFNDPAMLRRDLLCCGIIMRKTDGSCYWRRRSA